MPGLLIHDGYTIEATTQPRSWYPCLKYRYRPLLPETVQEWRMAKRTTGKDEVDLRIRIMEKHIVDWDWTEKVKDLKAIGINGAFPSDDPGGESLVAVPIVADALRRLPDPVLIDIWDEITGYGPTQQRVDAKN